MSLMKANWWSAELNTGVSPCCQEWAGGQCAPALVTLRVTSLQQEVPVAAIGEEYMSESLQEKISWKVPVY